MTPETFLPVMYLATGALMIIWGLGLLRRFSLEELHRVVAAMLFFGGLVPILAGVSLVQPQSASGQIFLLGGFLDRFSYTWEFFFPTLLLFSLVFPRRRNILRRVRALPVLLYLPHVVHLLLILTSRRGDPSRLVRGIKSQTGFLDAHLSTLDSIWDLAVGLHQLLFPGVNLLMGLTALILLMRSEDLRREVTLRRQRLFLALGFTLPLTGYLIAEGLPLFVWREGLGSAKPHILSASIILSSATIAYAVVRHRFLRIRLLARRGVLDLSVSLLLAIIYLFLLDRFQAVFGTYLGTLSSLFKAGLTVFAIVLFQPLLSRVEAVLDQRLFGHSRDPRREALRRFGTQLGELSGLKDIEEALEPILQDVFHIDESRIYAWDYPADVAREEAPDWFLSLGRHRKDLLELQEPLRWSDFQAWCLRVGLPAPPAAPLYGHLLPLSDEATCRGLLLLGHGSERRRLRGIDREHLVLLAGQLAAALHNLELLAELLEKRILDEEVQLAQRIQLGLLPKAKPALSGLSLHGTSLPSRQVGGDYYDWIERNGELTFVIGDVSGKGIPAALLMATLQASFRAIAREEKSPGDLLHELNEIIYENSPPDRFVTLWLGKLKTQSLTLEYASAGHPPPLLTRRGGLTVPLEEGGMVLGAFPNIQFSTRSIPFGAGDRLVCYTDGVSETANARGEQFADRRLSEVLSGMGGGPQEVVENLLTDLSRFSVRGEPEDDCTLLVLMGEPEGSEAFSHAR